MPMLTFQSTPPVKAATFMNEIIATNTKFQSTPPVKAATRAKFLRAKTYIISIHAAREGGDVI